MVDEHYPFIYKSEDRTFFLFVSKGSQGEILKAVSIKRMAADIWNLGFGDFEGGAIRDKTKSGNHDVRLVLSTVAAAAYSFWELHPLAVLRVLPVDRPRMLLYNRVVTQRFDEISERFEITAKEHEHDVFRPFRPGAEYFEFKFAPKFGA